MARKFTSMAGSTSSRRAPADLIFKQPSFNRACAITRILYRRRVRRLSFFSPRKYRGDGAPSGAPVFRLAAFPHENAGASRRSIAASRPRLSPRTQAPGPRFLVCGPVSERPWQNPLRGPCLGPSNPIGTVPVQRSSSRSGRSAARAGPRGLPSAWLRTTPAGATSDPAITTPHESALGGSDGGDYSPMNMVLSSAGSGSV